MVPHLLQHLPPLLLGCPEEEGILGHLKVKTDANLKDFVSFNIFCFLQSTGVKGQNPVGTFSGKNDLEALSEASSREVCCFCSRLHQG
jgi:hypothetical protein